jgi:hypothetical protein
MHHYTRQEYHLSHVGSGTGHSLAIWSYLVEFYKTLVKLKARSFGDIDPKTVPSTLVPPCHLGRRVPKMLLNITLINFRGGGEPRAKGVAGKLEGALDLAEIAAHAGSQCGALYQPRHFPVVQPFRPDRLALSRNTPKERTVRQPGELDPGLDCDDRARSVGGTAADLDLSPSGFSAQGEEHTLVEDLDPTATVLSLVGLQIEADDLGAPKPPSKADE